MAPPTVGENNSYDDEYGEMYADSGYNMEDNTQGDDGFSDADFGSYQDEEESAGFDDSGYGDEDEWSEDSETTDA
ncbi:MAG: hypothetical protein WBD20_17395 [Pirellulaceae bacterium]